MSDKTSLGDRMKSYECWGATQPLLPQFLPVIIRIDGKTFSSWTRGFPRPYDRDLIQLFQRSTLSVMETLLTEAVIAYGQSDEVTFVLRPATATSQVQFGGKREKLVSLTASGFTAAFNALRQTLPEHISGNRQAVFDSRVFPVPTPDEALNCLIWRQQDATRNSIQSAGRAVFSHQQMQDRNTSEIQELLWAIHGINWNNYPAYFKRGWCITRKQVLLDPSEMTDIPEAHRPTEPILRRRLVLHEHEEDMPIFTQDRDFVLSLLETP